MTKPVLQVIVGSTRPGRVGSAVADWIIERASARGDFEVVVSDLAVLNLPIFDEPNHPRLRRYVNQHTKDWSAVVDRSDAFVFVIPEYNYGFNTRAAQMLKQVMSALKMVPVVDSVNIPFVKEKLDEDGRLKPNEIMETAATAMLDELARYGEALRPLRASSEG